VRVAAERVLFDADELALRSTGTARLRELVRGAPPRRGARDRRRQEDAAAMRRLLEIATELAPRFKLRYSIIEPELPGVNEHYGVCYADGTIRIRLRHARSGRLLKESSLVDTLCHELAHLRHMNHGMAFRRLYRRILDAAREAGHYRPGPVDAAPRQGRLFDDASCGSAPARGPGEG
jgi:predicted metal-dependent hydrolase